MLFQSRIWRGYVGRRAARRLWIARFAWLIAAPALPAAAEETTNWTILTVARNGNWGIATDKLRAIEMAMKHQGLFERDNLQKKDNIAIQINLVD
jgi:hypothetical protein